MASIEELLLRVVADDRADEALKRLEERLRELGRTKAEPKVEPKTGTALKQISDIRKQLRALSLERAHPSATFDDAKARAEIDALEAKLRELGREHETPTVRLATARARAEIDKLRNSLDGVSREADKAEKSVAGIQLHSARLPAILAAASPALLPLVGTLAQAALGAGALGVAAAGAGVAFYALARGMEYAAKHGSGQVKQSAQEMKQAFADVRTTILQSMTGAFEGIAAGMAGMLQSMRPALASLKPAWTALGTAIRNALTDPAIQGAVQQLIRDFGSMVRAVAPLAGPLLQAIVQLGDAFIRIATAAMPRLVPLVQQLANWLANINSQGNQQNLTNTINRWINSFLQVGRVVVQLVRDLAPLLQGGGAASGLLFMVSVTGRLVNAFLRLLNAMGPVGQLIAGGLGVALLIGRFSGLLAIFGRLFAGIGLLRAAFAALRGGGGIAGVIGALRGMTGASHAARDAQGKLIDTKRQEKQAATEAAHADSLFARAIHGVASAAPGARAAVAALSAAAVGAGVAFGPQLLRAVNSGIGRIPGTIRSYAGPVRASAGQAFGGIAQAARQITPTTQAAVRQTMNAARSVVGGSVGAIGAAARGAFHTIPLAAHAIGPYAAAAMRNTMQGGVFAVNQSVPDFLGAMGKVSRAILNVITQTGQGGQQHWAANLKLFENVITGQEGNMRNSARTSMRPVEQVPTEMEPVLGAIGLNLMSRLAGGVRGGSGAVGGAARAIASAIKSPIAAVGSAMSGIGSAIGGALSRALLAQVGSVGAAAQSLASAISGHFPHSEPKDPRSPLRNLAASGRAIVMNLIAGIDPAPFRAAMQHALMMPALPTGQLHLGAVGMAGRGGTHHHHDGAQITNIFRIETLHPGDPKVLREISNIVSVAQRRSFSQRPPVRA